MTTRAALGVAAALAGLAAWIAVGPIHGHAHADALVPVLASLERWTPFYWEQSRYGLLVPLLAAPVREPFANLLVETWLTALAGLAAFFLLARAAFGRAWVVAGALAALAHLASVPPEGRYELLGTAQPYGTALALGAAGLVALERPGRVRVAAGAALLALACFVNVALAVALVPLALARALLRAGRARRAALAAAALALAAFAVAFGAASLVPFRQRHHLLPPSAWPAAWAELARACAERQLGVVAFAFAALGAGACARGRRRRVAVAGALALAVGALASFAGLGALKHVRENASRPRYATSSVVLAEVALAGLALAPARALLPRRRRRADAAAVAALAGGVALLFGPPSFARARSELDRATGALTDEIVRARCTHVLGSHAVVWPAVFHANLVLRERGSPERVHGLSQRSGPTEDLWRFDRFAEVRVAALEGDPEVEAQARRLGLPRLVVGERLARIVVLVPER